MEKEVFPEKKKSFVLYRDINRKAWQKIQIICLVTYQYEIAQQNSVPLAVGRISFPDFQRAGNNISFPIRFEKLTEQHDRLLLKFGKYKRLQGVVKIIQLVYCYENNGFVNRH